jgi:hypothetical protein
VGSSKRVGTPESIPLIQEIDVSLYSAGARVTQAQYGDGTVTSVNERHTVIYFDMHGVRTFATPLVRLEASSTIAPPKIEKPRRRAVKRNTASQG